MSDESIPFVQAANYTKAGRSKVLWIVVHTMEVPERIDTAENVAKRFSTTDKPKSCHFCIDNNSIVQCVEEEDVAWHAPGANKYGLGLEHAGSSQQTQAEWDDTYSLEMLTRSARLAARLCKKWNIPIVRPSVPEILADAPGIIGHGDASEAFKKSTHTDPGPSFPWAWYLSSVKLYSVEL